MLLRGFQIQFLCYFLLLINMQNTVIVLCFLLKLWNEVHILNWAPPVLCDSKRKRKMLAVLQVFVLTKCVYHLLLLKVSVQFCVSGNAEVSMMFRKDTQGGLGVVSIFKAGATVPAVVVSSPEVKISCVPVGGGRERISPVGVFVVDALCRLRPAGCAFCCSQPLWQ